MKLAKSTLKQIIKEVLTEQGSIKTPVESEAWSQWGDFEASGEIDNMRDIVEDVAGQPEKYPDATVTWSVSDLPGAGGTRLTVTLDKGIQQ